MSKLQTNVAMKKIACLGSVTADIIVRPVGSLPPPGTLRQVDGISMHVGGCAANAAIDLAKLGAEVSLVCKLGLDSFGGFVKSEIVTNGIDPGGLVFGKDTETTVSIVCVSPAGERSFFYASGSTGDFSLLDIDYDYLNDCGIVFIAGAFLLTAFDGLDAARFLREMRESGRFTAMDTAWDFTDTWLPKIRESIQYLDLFMPSYDEAVKITGCADVDGIADSLFGLGAKSVIIKTGEDGAYICENEYIRYQVPAYSNITVRDTTGAGDAFCAGFLAGIAQGWNYRRSAEFANASGAHCVMEIGASAGIKPMSEIIRFMEERKQ